jgi:hypothetical protein
MSLSFKKNSLQMVNLLKMLRRKKKSNSKGRMKRLQQKVMER